MEQWYTLHTKPKAEYQVTAVLQQREIETYLPEIIIPAANKGKRKQPFFPCYLFARIDFERVGLSAVQWTPGLRRVVIFEELPAAVPAEVIALIRQKLDQLESAGGLPPHNFKSGDTVRIKEGPFQDMLALFSGPTTSAQRVQVLLNILGQACRVQVELASLEKAEGQVPPPVPFKRPRRTRGRGRYITYAGPDSPNWATDFTRV